MFGESYLKRERKNLKKKKKKTLFFWTNMNKDPMWEVLLSRQLGSE
jgi:hypothetical protein